jgi:hypothetical protein
VVALEHEGGKAGRREGGKKDQSSSRLPAFM